MANEIEHIDLRSHDLSQDKALDLIRLFPEILTEGNKIDFERLRLVLGKTVDVGKERFSLAWPGKADCFKTIQTPSTGTLVPAPDESVEFNTTENLIIEGDNLNVLKLLQKAYLGKVKMIYIDPPYNTGNDFIYPDNYTESLQTYLEYTGQVDVEGKKFGTNTDTDGRFHSRWLNMMYPRLYLARNLLRDDGVIFISIDDGESANLRKLCDEIFGEENFKADIAWQKRYTRSNNTVDFTTMVEHIFVYAKGEMFNVSLLERTEEADARYSNPDNDPRGDWKGASFLNPATPQQRPNLVYPIKNPNTGQITNPTTNAWRRSREEFERLQQEGRLYWGIDGKQPVPSIKMYLSEARGLTPINFWAHEYAGNTDEGSRDLASLIPEKVFDNPKPVKLIKRAIEHGCDEDSIVLDFFAGSGVTAQAVLEKNKEDGKSRRFIMVQLPETCDELSVAFKAGYKTISEITKERTRRVIKKLNDEESGQLPIGGKQDRGFRVFKLAESNFKGWDSSTPKDGTALAQQLELHIDHIREGRTSDDILYEILLKSGFPLTTPVENIELEGKTVYSVAGGGMLICLEKELTLEVIRAMAERKPQRVICLDLGFVGNDQLKANAVQIFKTKEVVFKTV
jgi:adenine-specific DNA-methyltransferase